MNCQSNPPCQNPGSTPALATIPEAGPRFLEGHREFSYKFSGCADMLMLSAFTIHVMTLGRLKMCSKERVYSRNLACIHVQQGLW